MKRLLLIPSCALLALSTLTSCQKEEKTALELSQELTAELQKVVSYKTAEAAAPRVEALNKRFQNAGAHVFALGGSALCRSAGDSGHEGDAYAESLAKLAREVGRIRASMPVATADGEVDRDRLILAVGAANGAGDAASAAERKEKGVAYLHGETESSETPGNFAEYYGSAKLRAALEFTVAPGKATNEVVETPESVTVEDEEMPADVPAEEEPAADDSADTEEPAADDSADAADGEEPAADDSADDAAGEEPAADDSAATDEEPAADDSADESGDADLPSLDLDSESSDDAAAEEEPAAEEEAGDDAGEVEIDLDL
ncbi:MAG: hypothetical protein IKV82_01815 [Akkermansia sp.]|nr:hypothetical protein [Akkermansia sp.]